MGWRVCRPRPARPRLDGAGLECVRVVVPEYRCRRVPLLFEGRRVNLLRLCQEVPCFAVRF